MNDPLYSTALLRLAAEANGAGRLAAPDATYTERNPACGDATAVDLALDGSRIDRMAHDTRACVLTQASASILASAIGGADIGALEALKSGLEAMLKGGDPPPPPFAAYACLREAAALPGRHRCVLLPVDAALKAMREAVRVR